MGSGSGPSDVLGKISTTELTRSLYLLFILRQSLTRLPKVSLEVTLKSSQALTLQSSCLRLYGSRDYCPEPPHPAGVGGVLPRISFGCL